MANPALSLFRQLAAGICCLFFLQFAWASSDVPLENAKQLANTQKHELSDLLGFPIRVLVVEKNTPSPFIAAVHKGQCIVFLNSKPESWDAWGKFRSLARLEEIDSYHFAFLHEVGHCVNKLNPAFTQSVLPEGVDSELYADVFAILAAKQLFDKTLAESIANGVVRARIAQSGFFFRSRSHNTGPRLKVIQQKLQNSPELLASVSLEPALLARQLVDEVNVN